MHSQWIAAAIVPLTYGAIAVGRVPRLRMNRATIALVGAAALLAVRAIDEEQAFSAIDLGTITLLFAMMIINNNLRLAGFYHWVGNRVLGLAHTPRALLGVVVVASGVLSALFLNDPICLLFTPVVVDLTRRARREPIPYLIGLATAANVGSTATITGNPQNVIIGRASGIPYLSFLLDLAPVSLIGLAICWGVIVLAFPGEFRRGEGLLPVAAPPRASGDSRQAATYQPLLTRSLAVVGGLLTAFLVGLPIAASALVAAGLLLISGLHPRKLLAVDGELLAFFAGLFVVSGAIEATGMSARLFAAAAPVLRGGVPALSLVTAALSNVVSNVPAVMLLRSAIAGLPNPRAAWLTVAMASTLAGNLTLLGSVANLIVAEVASARGVRVSFGAYLRVGVPITILTIAVGIVWLMLLFPVGGLR